MAKLHRYRIESDGGITELTSDGSYVLQQYKGNTGYFTKLRETTEEEGYDDFIFSYKHGQGEGTLRIPGHVLFDLPELIAVLNNAARKNGCYLFNESRIYAATPVATLFTNEDDDD